MLGGDKKSITSTIKAQVYHILKNEICAGELLPGQWLQEKELAKRLQVSRSPIREALLMLVSDGLVVEYPNKGVFVREFTEQDIEDVYDMRVMMESYAILNAASHLNKNSERLLRDYLDHMIAAHASGSLDSYINVDGSLHHLVISLSGNKLLELSYKKIDAIVQQFRIYSLLGQQRFNESVEEHRAIVECILSGALQKAIDVNHKHLMLAKDQIIEHLRTTARTHPQK